MWFGTWHLGGHGFGPSQAQDSLDLIDFALNSGIRYFDTAPIYGEGKSERYLGKQVSSLRNEVFLSSKVGLRQEGRHFFHDGSETGIRNALFASLERLNTDYLDLLSLHWPDQDIAISDSISSLQRLKNDGYIRQWGICNV